MGEEFTSARGERLAASISAREWHATGGRLVLARCKHFTVIGGAKAGRTAGSLCCYCPDQRKRFRVATR